MHVHWLQSIHWLQMVFVLCCINQVKCAIAFNQIFQGTQASKVLNAGISDGFHFFPFSRALVPPVLLMQQQAFAQESSLDGRGSKLSAVRGHQGEPEK